MNHRFKGGTRTLVVWPLKKIFFLCVFPRRDDINLYVCTYVTRASHRLATAGFLKTVPSVYSLLLNTIYPWVHRYRVFQCTGAFKFGCRIIFWSFYLFKSCRKSCLISLSIYRIHNKKIFILCFNFIKDINIYQLAQLLYAIEKS